MAIEQISATTAAAIKSKSAYGLPDRPSDQGMKPADIKRAFYAPVTDAANSIITEVNRIVEEANTALDGVQSDINDVDTAEAALENTVAGHTTALASHESSISANTALINSKTETLDDKIDTEVSEVNASLSSMKSTLEAQDSTLNAAITNLETKHNNFEQTMTAALVDHNASPTAHSALYNALVTMINGALTSAETSIHSVSYDGDTGILTFLDSTGGTIGTVDLPVESITAETGSYYDEKTKLIHIKLRNANDITISVEDLATDIAQAVADNVALAKEYRDDAESFKDAAEQSASNADTSAASASISSSNAKGYYDGAKTQAETATTQAGIATTKAAEITGLTVSTKSLPVGSDATVTKTGGSGSPYNLEFGIAKGGSQVTASTINGHININGTDTTVYDDKQCLYVDSEGYICLREE